MTSVEIVIDGHSLTIEQIMSIKNMTTKEDFLMSLFLQLMNQENW